MDLALQPPFVTSVRNLTSQFDQDSLCTSSEYSPYSELAIFTEKYVSLSEKLAELDFTLSKEQTCRNLPPLIFSKESSSFNSTLDSLNTRLEKVLSNRSLLTVWLTRAQQPDVVPIPRELRILLKDILISCSDLLNNSGNISKFLSTNSCSKDLLHTQRNVSNSITNVLSITALLDKLYSVLVQYAPI
ncbi:hypothetical protein RCL1_005621 [Eukaryota sp. TZLM3-RCL]